MERKPRAKSTFLLMQEYENDAGETAYSVEAAGPTDKVLMAKAKELGEGEYEIHYVRRKFKVTTKTETVIE